MPSSLKLPGVGGAVVPLVRAGDAVKHEFVAHRLPSLAAVIGALNQLPEPIAVLRRIEPIQIGGRSREMIDLPASKVGGNDIPPGPLFVGSPDEYTPVRPPQYAYTTHLS